MSTPLSVTFAAGAIGDWRIDRILPVTGVALDSAERLAILEGETEAAGRAWTLRSVTSNIRYSERAEVDRLAERQKGLRRPQATRAALIPIRKSDVWWSLAQNERRAIFEEQSRHIGIGLAVLPGVARRLHHSRDLGGPFDFLTWFEYAPEYAEAFERMVIELRQTPEWHYVEREVDIRLTRYDAI